MLDMTDEAVKFLKHIENYTDCAFDADGRVNIYGSLAININLDKFPVKFGKIIDHFHSDKNLMTSLEGAPYHVNGNFSCNYNKLTSLKGSPDFVGGNFYCHNNKLTSLDCSISFVGHEFSCVSNKLTSLHNIHKHIKEIGGIFYGHNNPIKDSVLGLLLIDNLKGISLDHKTVTKILNKYIGQGRSGVIGAQQELLDAGLDEYARL